MAIETTANKQAFIHGLATAAAHLLDAAEEVRDLSAIYTDRGYDSNHGGTDPITAEICEPMGYTAGNIYTAASILNDNLQAWLAVNRPILNIMRRDK